MLGHTSKGLAGALALAFTITAADAQQLPGNRTRCATPELGSGNQAASPTAGDCSLTATNPSSAYAPTFVYDIPVVFHVIQSSSGQGYVSPAQIQSQLDVLNEDFRALPGTAGGGGVDAMIQFHLATKTPTGQSTTGITYTKNDAWFADGGQYYNTLAWDPTEYLNIYSNDASGTLGYVPSVPQAGGVGLPTDRIVLYWQVVGKNAPYGAPYGEGRTATHEVGHYLGLYHTFQGSCGQSSCSGGGDLICDTPPESTPTYGCPASKSGCSSNAAIHNYMDYTDDTCVWEFSSDQVRRMRCTLEFWRSDLWSVSIGCGMVSSYCTSGTSAIGCKPKLSAQGSPSSTAPSGFEIVIKRGEGSRNGIVFFGTSGQQANPWGNGTSYQCVVPPVVRTSTLSLSGLAGRCNGTSKVDLNALWCPTCPKAGKNPGPGGTVQAQFWYRDPQNTSNQTTGFSDALSFVLCP